MSFESIPKLHQKPEQSGRFLEGNAVRVSMMKHLDSMSQKIDSNILKNIDPEYSFVRKFEQTTVEHGNLEIEMMGVVHVAETLPQHRKKIEEAIKNSDLIILETVIEAIDKQQIRGEGSMVSSGGMFFLEVERMARKHGKGLVTTDPYYGDRTHEDMMEKLEKSVENNRRFIGTTGLVVSIGGAGLAGVSVVDKFSGDQKNETEREDQKLSRRDFLNFAAAGTTALISHKVASITQENEEYGKPESSNPTFNYQLNDYRDVVIAEGIDMMSRSLTKKKKVSLLFGARHLKGIRYYLENPNIRRAKMELYQTFHKAADPKIRAYHFELDKRVSEKAAQKGNFGEWKKDVEMSIKTPQ